MIEGSLRDLPLSDVFQTVVAGQKSGILTVLRGVHRARIYFELGGVQYAHLSPGAHLGEIMVRMDLLTALEVQQILAKQISENAGTPLGLRAVAEGFVTEEDLRAALQRQVFDVITELMTWRDGEFSFVERSLSASQVPTEHTLDAMQLLMRVAQDLTEFEEGSVAPNAMLRRSGDPTHVPMPPGGWEVLGNVDGMRSARTIAAELDLPERQVYHILYQLRQLAVIEELAFEVDEPLVLIASPSTALQRILRLALQRARLRSEVALDFERALELAQQGRPSGVVVDDVAGEGWEFVRALRKLPGFSHTPVVLLASEDSGGLLARLRRPKAQILKKPFHEIDFQQLITRVLGRPLV